MSNDEPTTEADLQRLAAAAQIVAETTIDLARKRALSVIALKYKRLAEFVRLKAEASGTKAKTPEISTPACRCSPVLQEQQQAGGDHER